MHSIHIIAYKIYYLLKADHYHNAIAFYLDAEHYLGESYLVIGVLANITFVLSLGALAYAAVSRSSLQAVALKPEYIIASLLLLIALVLPPTILGIVNPGERVLYPALIAFAIAVCAEPKLPLAPKVTLTAAFIGGYGLLPSHSSPPAGTIEKKMKASSNSHNQHRTGYQAAFYSATASCSLTAK